MMSRTTLHPAVGADRLSLAFPVDSAAAPLLTQQQLPQAVKQCPHPVELPAGKHLTIQPTA